MRKLINIKRTSTSCMPSHVGKLKFTFGLRTLFMLLIIIEHLWFLEAASSIDLTTEFNMDATSKSGALSRFLKNKILAPTVPTKNSIGNTTSEEAKHLLVAMSSKSYITAPTTTNPTKLIKRAGNLSELKPRSAPKTLKDLLLKNRTRDIEPRTKQAESEDDHLTESTGHVPYRVGRPLLSPAPGGEGDYHAAPPGIESADNYQIYESEKWHNSEYWDREHSKNFAYNTTRVQHIEAECQDDYMKIRIDFNGSFNGLLYSAGYAYDPDCMYVNGSGREYYEFFIQLNRCGTLGKNSLHDESRKKPTNFMWNTVTVQYNPMIEEEYDEHFKVTCEYGYDFWKTVTFPFLDVEVATGNPVVFTLSPPECYMEIQNGYGVGGPRVTGPVRVGDPLTLIIYMRSKYDGFDIVVNDCYAHNGANKRIQLIDEFGCPVDDKLISRFRGSWTDSGVFETQVYAYMKTFRFTGSPALYIECDVRMCHGRCPSQPCHWRNLKAVTKRDISNASYAALTSDSQVIAEKQDTALSENVNLFQSLHVLQEGESDEVDDVYASRQRHENAIGSQQTCLKTSTLTALLATCGLLLSTLSAALIVALSRLKQRSKQAMLYTNYITHKGQID